MDPQRELRFYLNARLLVAVLLGCLAGATPFSIVVAVSSDSAIATMFAVFTAPFALGVFYSLSMLVLLLLFRKPVLVLDGTGIMYASPHMPWRSVRVPWNDVTSLNFLQRSAGSGRYRSSSSQFLIYTKHPARYGSQIRRRLSAWWDPELGDATIAVSSGLIGVGSMERRQWLLASIKTTFAHEIAKYGIATKPYM